MHIAASSPQPLEFCKASLVAGDGLPIDQAGGGFKRAQRLDDEREAFGPVVPIAGEKPHSSGAAPRQEPEAIVLDFVNPIAAGRRPLDRDRQARLTAVGK